MTKDTQLTKNVEHMDGVELLEGGRKWIEEVINQTLPPNPLFILLSNGFVLDRLARILEARYFQRSCILKPLTDEMILRPIAVDPRVAYRTQVLVANFLKFCKDFGVEKNRMCLASDVMEPQGSESYRKLALCLYALWNLCRTKGIDYSETYTHESRTISPIKGTLIDVSKQALQRLYLPASQKLAQPLPELELIIRPQHNAPPPFSSHDTRRAFSVEPRHEHIRAASTTKPPPRCAQVMHSPERTPPQPSRLPTNPLTFAQLATPSPQPVAKKRSSSAPRRDAGKAPQRTTTSRAPITGKHHGLHGPLYFQTFDLLERVARSTSPTRLDVIPPGSKVTGKSPVVTKIPSRSVTPSRRISYQETSLSNPGAAAAGLGSSDGGSALPRSRRPSELAGEVMGLETKTPLSVSGSVGKAVEVPRIPLVNVQPPPPPAEKGGISFPRLVLLALAIGGAAAKFKVPKRKGGY